MKLLKATMPKTGNRRRSANRRRRSEPVPRRSIPKWKIWSVTSEAEPMAGLSKDNEPFNIYQTIDLGVVVTTSSGAEVDFGIGNLFNQLGQVANLAAIFDQYRIAEVEAWITPTYQDFAGGNSAARYAVVVDYDNVSSITFAAAQQYTNCIVAPATNGVYLKYVPHVPATTAAGASSVNLTAPWIDCATSNVTHCGIKISCPSTNVTYTLNLRFRYHVQLRNVI